MSRADRNELWWALGFVALGAAARTQRWLLAFPFWGDEANLALNFLDRPIAGALAPLEHAQVAPVGFVAAEIALYQSFGAGEVALRALPWLASIASLLCFLGMARALRDLIPGLPARFVGLSVGIFAVSHYLIRYGSELKPYSCDLLVATLLLWLALGWLRAEERNGTSAVRWTWALVVVIAPALLLSYPAILVAGAVGLVLLPRVVRDPSRAVRRGYAAYGGLAGAAFAFSYLFVGRAQNAAASMGTEYLERFWQKAFPPGDPLALLVWLVDTHTGLLFAYPNGGKHGGSIATFALFVLGAWAVARGGDRSETGVGPRREVLALLLLPFVLGFVAAALHLYPYGGHLRLTLYLAPSICLLAGVGLAAALARIPSPEWRARGPRIALAALLVVGIADMVLNLVEPFRDERHAGMRAALQESVGNATGRDRIVSLHSLDEVRRSESLGSMFEWYLRTSAPGPVRWGEAPDAATLRGGGTVLVVARVDGAGDDDLPGLAAWLAGQPSALQVVERRAHCLRSKCDEAIVTLTLAPLRTS